MINIINRFKDILYKHDINISDENIKKFIIYKNFLQDSNKKFNLTSIKEDNDIMIKHFLDSIFIIKHCKFKKNSKIIDIGSGAGFPSVPIKILIPDIHLTLIDSVHKKTVFLCELIKTLDLSKTYVINCRAEEMANSLEHRENYDYVLSRAVSNLRILSEYAIPFLKINGIFYAYKGYDIESEISESKKIIDILGGEIIDIKKYTLHNIFKRSLIEIKKISHTPTQYPRKTSKILKQFI